MLCCKREFLPESGESSRVRALVEFSQIVWWHETGGERLVAEENEVLGFQLFGIRRVQPDLG